MSDRTRGALPPDAPDGNGSYPDITKVDTKIERRALILITLAAAACGGGGGGAEPGQGPGRIGRNGLYPNETPQLRGRINYWSRYYGVPTGLVQRIILRESQHRPGARNGNYYGLMQIHPQTARIMGHRGAPAELLDADTNMRYGVKYLRGAWMVAEGDAEGAMAWYQKGYYNEAKRRGLLKRTGLSG